MRHRAQIYAAVVWSIGIILLGYECLRVVSAESEVINFHFKTLGDILNGNS